MGVQSTSGEPLLFTVRCSHYSKGSTNKISRRQSLPLTALC